jgi:hypothetical protein
MGCRTVRLSGIIKTYTLQAMDWDTPCTFSSHCWQLKVHPLHVHTTGRREEYTLLVYFSGGGKGYTPHVHTAGGENGCTLHVFFAGGGKGYSLHGYSSGGGKYTPCTPIDGCCWWSSCCKMLKSYVSAGMPECWRKGSAASAILLAVKFISPASAFWHWGQSATASDGLARHPSYGNYYAKTCSPHSESILVFILFVNFLKPLTILPSQLENTPQLCS